MAGRVTELEAITTAVADPGIYFFAVTGFGGLGKTCLVHHWFSNHQENGSGFGYSFYNQGAHLTGTTTSSEFFSRLFQRFGLSATQFRPDEQSISLILDEIVQQVQPEITNPFVFLLDGLEPLQQGDSETARLTDPALRLLFHQIRQRRRLFFCLVTSRLPLDNRGDPGFVHYPLKPIDEQGGVAILLQMGANGTNAELVAAVHAFEGHPFSIRLLATALKHFARGDISRRSEIRSLGGSDTSNGMLRWYEQTLKKQRPEQHIILSLVGLFDVAVAPEFFLKIARTSGLVLTSEEFQRALSDLEGYGLFLRKESFEVDCHALTREYFRNLLREDGTWERLQGQIWRKFLKLADAEPEPTSLEDMSKLFRAVRHRCYAGEFSEALQMYRLKVQKGSLPRSHHRRAILSD